MTGCPKCGQNLPLTPLHGDRGGPRLCGLCAGKWNAKFTRRRKWGRIVVKAMKAYQREGGKFSDLDRLKLASVGWSQPGFDGDTIGAEVGDITSELLADTLQLTHPDRHPPERRELAGRVTQELLALKPFVFPAPKPEAPPGPTPARDTSVKTPRREMEKPSRPAYPCEDCADTTPAFYCDPCKAEYERLQQAKRDKRERERQDRNARQRERYAQRRRWVRKRSVTCATCGELFALPRRDAKYCSQACRQKAYVSREGRGSNDKPLSRGEIEQRIETAFAAEPDNALTVADLCDRVFPDLPRRKCWSRAGLLEKPAPEKKHRAAVIAAAKRIIDRQPPGEGWDSLRSDNRGGGLVFFNLDSLHSYAMARLKGDWLHAGDTEEALRARIAPGGHNHQYIAEGGAWRRHWQIWVAEAPHRRSRRCGGHRRADRAEAGEIRPDPSEPHPRRPAAGPIEG